MLVSRKSIRVRRHLDMLIDTRITKNNNEQKQVYEDVHILRQGNERLIIHAIENITWF